MTTKSSKPKPYKRSSKGVKAGVFPYPKRYEIRVEPDASGVVTIYRTNENFNAYELYGHLCMVTLEIEKQIMYASSDPPGTELIEKKKK